MTKMSSKELGFLLIEVKYQAEFLCGCFDLIKICVSSQNYIYIHVT